jgi:hypothetical protein
MFLEQNLRMYLQVIVNKIKYLVKSIDIYIHEKTKRLYNKFT